MIRACRQSFRRQRRIPAEISPARARPPKDGFRAGDAGGSADRAESGSPKAPGENHPNGRRAYRQLRCNRIPHGISGGLVTPTSSGNNRQPITEKRYLPSLPKRRNKICFRELVSEIAIMRLGGIADETHFSDWLRAACFDTRMDYCCFRQAGDGADRRAGRRGDPGQGDTGMAMAICIVADVVTIMDGAGAADIITAGVIIVITTSCRLH